jgi:hypothetical protein
MGIAVWGIADKYSQVEVSLKAVPNACNNKVPPTIYLSMWARAKAWHK